MKIYVQCYGRSGSNNFVNNLSKKFNLKLYNDINYNYFINNELFYLNNILVKSVHYGDNIEKLTKIVDQNFSTKIFLERIDIREMAISNLRAIITNEWHFNRKYFFDDIDEDLIQTQIKLFETHINNFKNNINKDEWIFLTYENLYNISENVRAHELKKLNLFIEDDQILEFSKKFKPKRYGGKKISYIDFVHGKFDKNKIF